MKKLFTLLVLLVAIVTGAQADVIYQTDVKAEPTSPATATSATGTFATTAVSWATDYSNYFLTSGSAGQYTLNFSTPIDLSDYTDVKVKVYWGAGSNRPLNLTINGGTATQIDAVSSSGERNQVRTAESDLSETSLSSLKLSSSGGGNVYLFNIEISGTTSDGKTNLVGAWSDAAPTFEYGATATIPTFSVTPATAVLEQQYNVEYALVSGTNVVVVPMQGITDIDTNIPGTSVVKATITVLDEENYKATTAEYTTTITVNEEQTTPSGNEYKITFNGKNAGDTDFFTWNSAKHNFNTKFNGATYDGTEFVSGLKMEGATNVGFTSTATATVKIAQSTWSANTIKFDGTELAVADATEGTGYREYVITDVEAGTHSITRGSGESGLFQVTVIYTGTVVEQLADPQISYTAATGEVSIAADDNAENTYYTTDGTEPSASNGTEYNGAFTVADGTVVKAISIGDGTNYANSSVTSETVLLTGIVLATPTITSYNGTFAITTTSPNATLYYSIDGGDYQAYDKAVTVFEDATVSAKAIRTGCTDSEVATANVTAVAASKGTKMVFMGWNDFQETSDSKVRNGSGDAEGYVLTMVTSQDKSWQYGSDILYEGASAKQSIKGSNGAQVKLTLPEGTVAKRLILYSYINNATIDEKVGWSEFNGSSVPYTTVPMGDFSDRTAYLENPDVRVFPLDGTETEITFNNAGRQLCFVIGLEVQEVDIVLDESGSNATAIAANVGEGKKVYVDRTLSNSYYNTLFLPFAMSAEQIQAAFGEGVQVATFSGMNSDTQFGFTNVTAMEANTGYLVKPAAAVNGFTVEGVTITSAATVTPSSDWIMYGSYDTFDNSETNEVYYFTTSGKVKKLAATTGSIKGLRAFMMKGATEQTVKAINSNVELTFGGGGNVPDQARADFFLFLDGGTTTGINSIENGQIDNDAPAYNLAGQKVGKGYKGIVIINGKKVVK